MVEPSDSIPGVIEKNNDGTMAYRVKERNLSSAQKLPYKLVFSAYACLTAVIVVLVFISGPCEKEECPPLLLGLPLIVCIPLLSVLFSTTYDSTFHKQHVECLYVQRKLGKSLSTFYFGFVTLISWCPIPYYVIFDQLNTSGIVSVVYSTISASLVIALLYYEYKYCPCKTCLKLKDVKICFSDETLDIAETDKVTKEFLIHQFRLQLLPDEVLALKLETESRVHTFGHDDLCIQLHEGTYVLYKRIPEQEVKLRYMEVFQYTSENTEICEKMLKTLFGIDSKGIVAIQTTDGKLLHTLQYASDSVKLKEGTYIIRVMNLEPDRSKRTLNEKSPEEEKPNKPDCTILTVD